MTERNGPERGVASVETQRERPAENRCDTPLDVRYSEPRGAREHEPVAVDSGSEASARIPKTASWSNRPVVVALLFLGLFMGAAGTYFIFFRTGIDQSGPPSTVTSEREVPGKDLPPVESTRERRPVHAAEPPTALRPSKSVAVETSGPGHLTVPEFGVGRRIVERRLEGRDERFAEGDVVWFSTRVLGGQPGEPIRHVWLHEGKALQSIELGLGGPDWRTQSSKTLRHVGQWGVEARDKEGRVLARATFTCEPAGP